MALSPDVYSLFIHGAVLFVVLYPRVLVEIVYGDDTVNVRAPFPSVYLHAICACARILCFRIFASLAKSRV